MLIKSIYIEGVRNLQQAKLNFHPEINVFVGSNGSGKTSLLESIFFLALGRSFRAAKFNNLINFNNDFVAVSAIYSDKKQNKQIKIGSLKYKNQDKISKIGGATAGPSQIAILTPTQIVDNETSKLIFKEPDGRRKFLDWLVFYSNKNYQHLWKEFNKSLQQRNNLLKKPQSNFVSMLNNIDHVFVCLSEKIKIARQEVWHRFEEVWLKTFNDLGFEAQMQPEIKLFDGWNGDLLKKMKDHRDADLRFGVTHYGPHRADLQFLVNGKAAKEVLSRGQGKVLSLAMILARSQFIKTIAEREDFVSVLLIDDLCAELDNVNTHKVIKELFCLRNSLQMFITGADEKKLIEFLSSERLKWFDVVGGVITERAIEMVGK